MPVYMIETTYKLPVYRLRLYQAGSLEEACLRAVQDPDWEDEQADIEASERSFVSGVWEGTVDADPALALPVPSSFQEAARRKAALVEAMRELLAAACAGKPCHAWRDRARLVLAQADAVGPDRRAYWSAMRGFNELSSDSPRATIGG